MLPQQKLEIEGSKPKKLFQTRQSAGDFGGLSTQGIEGSAPQKVRGSKAMVVTPSRVNILAHDESSFQTPKRGMPTNNPFHSSSAKALLFGGGANASSDPYGTPKRNA